MYRNARQALIGELKYLLEHGNITQSRIGGEVREVCARTISIQHPEERFLLLAQRNDNPIAKIAETLWVLGGRNDLNYLSHYLPRARDFSDDGVTWRAAYGQRLRHWHKYGTSSVDQIKACLELLTAEPTSRRAVMTIFDPSVDYQTSKDIPCNNWIQWLIRDHKLHMYVTVRSNDLMWGFSGINTFEWSVLHQFMASWLDCEVGEYHQFTGSLHLYGRHFARAERMLQAYNGYEPYQASPVLVYPDMNTPFGMFDALLQRWFFIELKSRASVLHTADEYADCYESAMALPDLWLREAAYAIIAANALPYNIEAAWTGVVLMPTSAMSLSVMDYFTRISPEFAKAYGDRLPTELNQIYALPESKAVTFDGICQALQTLEYKKTLRYGQSWRKHGEVLSIFANISRKYDRLETMLANDISGTADESIVDTWADLAVYCLKYAGFLGETYHQIDLPQTFPQAIGRLEDYHGQEQYVNLPELYSTLERVLTSDQAYQFDMVKYHDAMLIAYFCISEIVNLFAKQPGSVQKWLQSVEAL